MKAPRWGTAWGTDMATGKISASRLRNLKPGKYGDGGGLWLRVRPNLTAFWIFRYQVKGKSHEMSLGPLSDVNVITARDRAQRFRNDLRAGLDPMVERNRERAKSLMVFSDAVDRMIASKEAEWRNAKHRKQWRTTLEKYALPILGQLPVDAIETDDILRCLEPIWREKTETASRLRQRIEATLDWCTARQLRRGENPARWRGHLDKLLPKPAKVKQVRHHAALPYAELPDFMTELAKQPGVAALALQFLILTAARTGEIIGATWDEIETGKILRDAEYGTWSIPGERMKAARPHRIPLSKQAVALLETLPRFEGSPYVFAGQHRDRPLSTAAMTATLKRMKRGELTVHGFRSTFRDWCAEVSTFPRELAELSLAHRVGSDVELAYRRGDMIKKRALLMQTWADYATTPRTKGDVIPIRKAAQ
jgi:integrase